MLGGLPKSWKDDFAIAVSAKRQDLLEKEKLLMGAARDRERRAEQRAEDARDAAMLDLIVLTLATPQDVAAFTVELDDYDASTVIALINNEEARAFIRSQIDDLLDEAYVMEDGRRVFKTRDGQRVFDENGLELHLSDVDPDAIEDSRPDWETYEAAIKERQRLDEEHTDLLAYQAKLDDARGRIDDGEISKKELEAIRADLVETMPEAVRADLGLEQLASAKPGAAATATAKPALPDDMETLMRQTGLQQGPSTP